jgi:hypothetical protein
MTTLVPLVKAHTRGEANAAEMMLGDDRQALIINADPRHYPIIFVVIVMVGSDFQDTTSAQIIRIEQIHIYQRVTTHHLHLS